MDVSAKYWAGKRHINTYDHMVPALKIFRPFLHTQQCADRLWGSVTCCHASNDWLRCIKMLSSGFDAIFFFFRIKYLVNFWVILLSFLSAHRLQVQCRLSMCQTEAPVRSYWLIYVVSILPFLWFPQHHVQIQAVFCFSLPLTFCSLLLFFLLPI